MVSTCASENHGCISYVGAEMALQPTLHHLPAHMVGYESSHGDREGRRGVVIKPIRWVRLAWGRCQAKIGLRRSGV